MRCPHFFRGFAAGLVIFSLHNVNTGEGSQVQPGSSLMVSLSYDGGAEAYSQGDERPQHRVRITKPFYFGKYPVTQGEWEKLMGNNPSSFKGDDQLPVDTVTWNVCQEFVKKAGSGMRLPTEAEWEYACRAGSTSAFYFGDKAEELGDSGWYEANSEQRTHPVGQKTPNGFGLYDMHGNIWQWCQDWYGADYYSRSPSDDPTGPGTGEFRVLRGGAWYHYAHFCRSGSRNGWSRPTSAINTFGLRVAAECGDTSALAELKPQGASMTLRVPLGFRASPSAGHEPYAETSWAKEVIHDKTGMEMVFIPAGDFMMGCPSEDGVAFYNEVTVTRSAAGTYFMVCGWDGGYFGIQELDSGRKVVLFSVWDSANGNDPNTVADARRTRLIYQGQGVRVGRFGGEGTGWQCFFDYAWKLGQTYRFYVAAQLKEMRTEYTGYFYLPESKQWKKLVTFSKLTDGKTNLRGYYSFIEDFKRSGISSTWSRKANFGGAWIRKAGGEWFCVNKATFHVISNPGVNMDVAPDGDRFYLATGNDARNSGRKSQDSINLNADNSRKPPEDLPHGD